MMRGSVHPNTPQYQVWRSTDACLEFWSWDDCDKEDFDAAEPSKRRIIHIIQEKL